MRTISDIAYDIRREWKNVNYAAKPYLEAMTSLETIYDTYIHDSAKGIVLRFLGNAGSFRGERAKALKAELKELLKGDPKK